MGQQMCSRAEGFRAFAVCGWFISGFLLTSFRARGDVGLQPGSTQKCFAFQLRRKVLRRSSFARPKHFTWRDLSNPGFPLRGFMFNPKLDLCAHFASASSALLLASWLHCFVPFSFVLTLRL